MTRDTGESATEAECWCGGIIHRKALPPDIANAAGQTHLWVHDHGDIYCYPDDQQACAEPYDSASSEGAG